MHAHCWKVTPEVEKLMPCQRSFVMCTTHSKHTIYFFASFVWIDDKILCRTLFATKIFFCSLCFSFVEVVKLKLQQKSFVMCTTHSKHGIYFFASFVWIDDKILCRRLFVTKFFFFWLRLSFVEVTELLPFHRKLFVL